MAISSEVQGRIAGDGPAVGARRCPKSTSRRGFAGWTPSRIRRSRSPTALTAEVVKQRSFDRPAPRSRTVRRAASRGAVAEPASGNSSPAADRRGSSNRVLLPRLPPGFFSRSPPPWALNRTVPSRPARWRRWSTPVRSRPPSFKRRRTWRRWRSSGSRANGCSGGPSGWPRAGRRDGGASGGVPRRPLPGGAPLRPGAFLRGRAS